MSQDFNTTKNIINTACRSSSLLCGKLVSGQESVWQQLDFYRFVVFNCIINAPVDRHSEGTEN